MASRKSEILSRASVWLLFGVVFGALPVLLSMVVGGLDIVLARGELLISSAAIAGGVIGELFYADVPSSEKTYRALAGGFCAILLCCSTAAFMVHGQVADYIVPLSWALFAGTVVAGLTSIAMVAGR